MGNKNEVNDYELRKEASEMNLSPEELRKLKNLTKDSKEKRANQFDKKQK